MTNGRITQEDYQRVLHSEQGFRGQSAVIATEFLHSPNKKHICKFMVVMFLSNLSAEGSNYMSVCATMFKYLYGWGDKEAVNLSLMNSLYTVGIMVGTILAGKLLISGRKLAFLATLAIGLLGSLMTFIISWPVFLIAKLICGMYLGMMLLVTGRFIEEYVPTAYYGPCAAVACFAMNLGSLLASMLGSVLPPDDSEEIKTTNRYLIVYAMQPIIQVACLVTFYLIVWTDTPKFCLEKGHIEKARHVIRKIYNVENDELKERNILRFFQVTSNKDGCHVTMMQALFTDSRYTRATWICITAIFFQVFCGFFGVIAYAN